MLFSVDAIGEWVCGDAIIYYDLLEIISPHKNNLFSVSIIKVEYKHFLCRYNWLLMQCDRGAGPLFSCWNKQ